MPGLFTPVTSPEFDITTPHCLSFDYDVTSAVSDRVPSLQVHVRISHHMLTGHNIWTMPAVGKGKATVTVPQMNSTDYAVLDFIGIGGDPTQSITRLANIVFHKDPCIGLHKETVILNNTTGL